MAEIYGRRHWVKLWTREGLTGTTRRELQPDERSIWWDFLMLAGDSFKPGFICVADNIPFSDEQLCHLLNITPPLLESAKIKMLIHNKIEVINGIIKIVNWEHYQGDYLRVQKHRQQRTEAIPAPDLKRTTDPPATPKPPMPPKNLATIIALWQANCGPVTPILAKELEDLSTTYKASWVDRAIEEAVKSGVRRLPYVVKILERYAEQGSPDPRQLHRGRPFTKPATKQLPTAAELQRQVAEKKGESQP